MKKLYNSIFIFALSFTLIACGGNDSSSDDSSGSNSGSGGTSGGATTGGSNQGGNTSGGQGTGGGNQGNTTKKEIDTKTPFTENNFAGNIKECSGYEAHTIFGELKKKLGLQDKYWCGNIKDRFSVINDGKKFIFDKTLNGYWSKSSDANSNFDDASNGCKALGAGWVFPDVYQMYSLINKTRDDKNGFIHPLFSDTTKNWFWTNSMDKLDDIYIVNFFNGIVATHPNSKVKLLQKYRCFQKK